MEKDFQIYAGSSSKALARQIAQKLGVELGSVDLIKFADGETFAKVNQSVRGCMVFIVQSTSKPVNESIMELLIFMDSLKRASAAEIIPVIPYYGYARQDRKASPREPITSKLIADILTVAGASRVVTMDLHARQIQGFFDIPVDHLYAAPVLIRHLREHYVKDLKKLVVVSPDVGGVKMARAYSDALGAELAIVAKHRVNATHVEAMNVIGDVEGRDAVLIDDMTETAGTLCAAANILKERGAQRVFACVSHGVLGDMARERISGSCIERVLTSDTVPMAYGPKVDCVSVGDLLGHAVQRIHDGESVSSLFDI